jgi:SAM-dependent methyltransferase
MASGAQLDSTDVIDLGSGTGYLADFFEGVSRSVLRVDKSPEMLNASGSANTVVSDMCRASQVLGKNRADLVTCLAAFHHAHVPEVPDVSREYCYPGTRHWGPERYLDIQASLQLQYDAVRDWVGILRPGGWLCLIDIPGYPDVMWDPFWPDRRRHRINTRGYHRELLKRLDDWRVHADPTIFGRFMRGPWRPFYESDLHLREVREMMSREFTMRELVDSYEVPEHVLSHSGPMSPADFFDDVIDGYGAQRHMGFFIREGSLKEALEGAGMRDIRSGTLPTPWLFSGRREAAWFVHELFGLGAAWEFNAIPEGELSAMERWIEHYLGFYQDRHGRTFLYWQLCYLVGSKPSEGIECAG